MVGLGGGTEVVMGAVTSEALGPAGTATFFGGGIQKRLIRETEGSFMPEVSLGLRGNIGPHDHKTGAGYLVGTKRLLGHECDDHGAWLTGGYQFEGYDSDVALFRQRRPGHVLTEQSSAGARAFGGLNIAFTQWLFAEAEIADRMPFEFNNPYVVKGIIAPFKGWGINGGVRNTGYQTHGFVGLETGDFFGIWNKVTGRG